VEAHSLTKRTGRGFLLEIFAGRTTLMKRPVEFVSSSKKVYTFIRHTIFGHRPWRCRGRELDRKIRREFYCLLMTRGSKFSCIMYAIEWYGRLRKTKPPFTSTVCNALVWSRREKSHSLRTEGLRTVCLETVQWSRQLVLGRIHKGA
jgi:hypothetical protein